MEVFYSTLLAVSAFWLGACPFSMWIGQWILGKDIRDYGDGNPGAINVFRAGGRKSGCLAAILDAGKGVPFVVLAHSFFGFSDGAVMAVALSAILGYAFSPLLRLRGGKSIGVTFCFDFSTPCWVLIPYSDQSLRCLAVGSWRWYLLEKTAVWWGIGCGVDVV